MPRPANDARIDLSNAHNITAGLIARLTCPAEKAQAFLRDNAVRGLRIRVTANGAKSFVYEQKLDGKTVRRTIGDVSTWTIEQARVEARQLSVLMDSGSDPRELDRQRIQKQQLRAQETARLEALDRKAALTVGDVWEAYVAARKDQWGALHYRDHLMKSSSGGAPSRKNGAAKTHISTTPGPLHALMDLRLTELNQQIIDAWAQKEAKTRPASARLALRLLGVFLNWCSNHPDYSSITPPRNPAKSRSAKAILGKPGVKHDVLLRDQLAAWFSAVGAMTNRKHAAYLQVLLLTGARPSEVQQVQWSDINTQWKGITIRDKVEGERVIPLTPYVAQLLAGLPRNGRWVFAGAKESTTGERPPMIKPNVQHTAACKVVGIDGLTLHGLRRSFKSLSEWVELPVGIVAQIMGHKPSATAEKHYTVRPLDLLRLHHERLEAWILEHANIPLRMPAEPKRLRAA